MKRAVHTPFLLLLLVLSGCAMDSRTALPELTQTGAQTLERSCGAVFPGGSWQFTHSIRYSRGGGETVTVLGVTSLEDRTIACALMTPEGFTLFAAVAEPGGRTEVRRAVPPFDRPGFAAGLIRDVRLIFLAPQAGTIRYGHRADNTPVCRSMDPGGEITDIIPDVNDCWRIETFTPEGVMDRSLVARSCRRTGDRLIPEHLELTGYGAGGYTLDMTLVTAENLNPDPLS